MDVCSDEDVRAGVDRVISDEGCIDHVFANAGYCLIGPVELQDAADVVQQFDVNVVGVGRFIAEVLPHMRAAVTYHIRGLVREDFRKSSLKIGERDRGLLVVLARG